MPELIIEALRQKTLARDLAPTGAKFLASQMGGVREYYQPLGKVACSAIVTQI